MKHLLISREYPPAPYPIGGIGTYSRNFVRLLAERGEVVHVIAQMWAGAPVARESSIDGRVVVHRVPMEPGRRGDPMARALFGSAFPPQAFAWHAALLAEKLIEQEGIDVIEGQDWEAPLYYLQARRQADNPTAPQPPIVLHLHSPTELIAAANEWDPSRPDLRMAIALENFSIRTADAWVSPSQFLAEQASVRYDLPEIPVIPYPAPSIMPLDRSKTTWSKGTIIFVGRLEPRKGIFEWTEAATRVAARHPDATFVFVGPDSNLDGSISVTRTITAKLPRHLRHRFRYLGEISPRELGRYLATGRLAVVPSRWDNLPYACLEAMASGLPVVTTRQGGMAELVVDGESGWLVDRADAADLTTQVEAALECSPEALAEMGRNAAASVRAHCDPDRVVEAHLEMRRGLRCRTRSFTPPVSRTTEEPLGLVPSHHLSSLQAVASLPLRLQLRAAWTLGKHPLRTARSLARRWQRRQGFRVAT